MMLANSALLNFGVVCALLLPAAFHTPETKLHAYEAVEPHMGTLVRIKLYAESQGQASAAFRAAFDRVGQLDDALSDYKPGSELNRISRSAVRHPVHVSDDLLRVVTAAQQIATDTDGAFDITLGLLTHLWREGTKKHRLPGTTELEEAIARCGYRKLHVDSERGTISFDQPGMQLDVGGIAKGDAADQALITLRSSGIHSALVAVSGDLAFSDAPPGEPGWKIGVDSLDNAELQFSRVLVLSNAAVSTSGNSEQHLDLDGKRYSHILDPKTGMGLTNDLSVTTVAKRGIDADPAATAVSVLGREKGMAFVERQHDLAVLIITETGGHQDSIESSRFPQ